MEAVFYHDGAWHDQQPMLIGPMNHAFWMSSVVFDGARSLRGLVPDLEEHCARLCVSARNMLLAPTLEPGEIAELCREGVRKLPRDMELYIRPMFYAREGFLIPEADSTAFVIAIYNSPIPPDGPFKVCLSSRRRPARDMAPTTAKASCLYPNTALALTDAAKRGFDNAIILDPNGNVAEFLSSNLFMAKDGVVFTPAINGTFLNGVTRQRTIKLLREDGVEVIEGTLTVDDVMAADEIFSTGNNAKVKAVTQFENRELQPGPMGRRAKDLYLEYAQGFSVF
ncbi:MAG: branched-chain amino acid aminotransferase [Alphaproteobacteria bacterium]|jgi:branched-chain amino acid aminotransferase|nr:branched-chain amino acid aminotransferase [Alphaproteobacteria bacterium]